MAKRLLITACLTGLLATACASLPEGEVITEPESTFVPQVIDYLDDAGLGNAIAVDAEGVPSISYLIFPAVLGEGELPVARPIGAPFITTAAEGGEPSQDGSAVGVASLAADGIWTLGAAAQARETPSGIVIPFGPPFVEGLVGMTTENSNGTDIAVDGADRHVAWAGGDGIYYAGGAASFSADLVYDHGSMLIAAGPIGRPGVAVHDGTPWVAFTVDLPSGIRQVVAATPGDDGWETEVAARIGPCEGCAEPARTVVGSTEDGLTVAFVDEASGAVVAATRGGDGSWSTTEVDTDAAGAVGLDIAVNGDGRPYLSYYAGGEIRVAMSVGDGWETSSVAEATPAEGIGNAAPTTGVAVDDQDGLYLTWHDDAADEIVLAVGQAENPSAGFEPLTTTGTSGGVTPSVGVAPDGSHVYLSWYGSGSLLFGIEGEVEELVIARPSPPPNPDDIPVPPVEGCGDDGELILEIVALPQSVFDIDCLVGPADEAFDVLLDNTDPEASHNLAIFPSAQETDPPGLFTGGIVPPSASETYGIDPIEAGTYFFRCDLHPTTMTGTFAAIEG